MFILTLPILVLIFLVFLAIDVALFINDRYVASFCLLVSGFIAYLWFGSAEPVVDGLKHFVTDYAIWYLVLGAVVAFIKWFQFLYQTGKRIASYITSFNSRDYKLTDQQARGFDAPKLNRFNVFLYYVNNELSGGIQRLLKLEDRKVYNNEFTGVDTKEGMDDFLTPKATEQKARITFWVLQWPIVLITMFVEDFLMKIGHRVAEVLDAVMGKMARMMVARATTNLK